MDKFVQQEIDNSKDESEKEAEPKCVPNWLIEVLAWINRIEMAKSSISISCRLFYKLCYSKLHGAVKPHIVPKLIFESSTETLKLIKPNLPIQYTKSIPIAEVPPPPYIIGSKSITLQYIDAQVLEFIKNILPVVSSRCVRYQYSKIPKYIPEQLWIVPNDIRQLLTILSSLTMKFNHQFFEQLDLPETLDFIQFLSLKWPPINPKIIESIVNWLNKPRIDGKPKFLYLEGETQWKAALINRIKKKFSKSTQPMTFFIYFDYCKEPKFKMENKLTGEVLVVNEENNDFQYINHNFNEIKIDHEKGWYLLRCPKGTENEWKEEGRRLFNSQMRNVTTFKVNWEKEVPTRRFWYFYACYWHMRRRCSWSMRRSRCFRYIRGNRILRRIF